MDDLTPRRIVTELDRHIVGQAAAKRAVAVAIRSRWRRQQLDPELAREVPPRNILMVGPTGVGKTEIARRVATLVRAPFIKVEATKFTEVGYHGRDVETMIRDLLELAIGMVRDEHAERVREQALERAEERLVALLLGEDDAADARGGQRPAVPGPGGLPMSPADWTSRTPDERRAEVDAAVSSIEGGPEAATSTASSRAEDASGEAAEEDGSGDMQSRLRARMLERLREGRLDDREIELSITEKPGAGMLGGLGGPGGPGMPGMPGGDQLDAGMMQMIEGLLPSRERRRRVTVARARDLLVEQETAKLVDTEKIVEQAIERTEQSGIVFLDELDKVAAKDGRSADVSREGVQRDLLPIVEGSSVTTRHGVVRTDKILFIAAGAFHVASVSDLMPELQGRFPIRVELSALTRDDFRRILVEPEAALTRQEIALLGAEGLSVRFEEAAIDAIADLAADANARLENIGARRLMTIMERVFEDLAFDAPDLAAAGTTEHVITESDVRERLAPVLADEDLSRFVL